MTASPLRVTIVQGATRWHDAQANRDYYRSLIAGLAGSTDLIVLPETFTSGFTNDTLHQAELMDGESVGWLVSLARELNAHIGGSLVIRHGDKCVNRFVLASPTGQLDFYDKRHLFRMAGEHQRYHAGVDRVTINILGWRVNLQVCYDLRFPVWTRNRQDFDLQLYVANWPSARRYAWSTLLRARAIENASYVVGVNRVGVDGNGLDYSGDSAVLDFLGKPIIELGSQEQVHTVALDLDALRAHREKFPSHLDADAFQLI